ncbi:MAG: 23S rRNA (adenine(2503)-C(2))-methyltransferase RlmN [Bacilli bacterium]|nr:23S rRNA (adenine(2503)-C(2))-methyltransferase RlmN [Bacilli bacterium]
MKTNLFGLTLSKMTEEFVSRGQTKFRAKQIFQWIYQKRVLDFDAMTDVSKAFRAELARDFCLGLPKVFTKQESEDGTIKLLLELSDGHKVETVLMPYSYGNAVCVSSQVGCNMGCAFCASGLLKRDRNLTPAEMVGEVMAMNAILAEHNQTVTHIDVMGTGEPFDNFDNVMDFLDIANEPFGLAIGARHITVSTCGLVPGIKKYGLDKRQFNLALSLHAPNDEIRKEIMPVARAYPIDELLTALHEYQENGGRRVTLEYIMLKGLNDTRACADQLADAIKTHEVYALVNLIPYNEVKEKPYRRSERGAVRAFADRLQELGINATIRKEFGSDIDAACGQLRAKMTRKKEGENA